MPNRVVINPAVSCRYFTPGPRRTSQSQCVAVLWPVPTYSALGQRNMRKCEQLAQSFAWLWSVEWLAVEHAISGSRVRRLTNAEPLTPMSMLKWRECKSRWRMAWCVRRPSTVVGSFQPRYGSTSSQAPADEPRRQDDSRQSAIRSRSGCLRVLAAADHRR